MKYLGGELVKLGANSLHFKGQLARAVRGKLSTGKDFLPISDNLGKLLSNSLAPLFKRRKGLSIFHILTFLF